MCNFAAQLKHVASKEARYKFNRQSAYFQVFTLISLEVTATSYMEGSQPFIYRCAPRGTRTVTLLAHLMNSNPSQSI